MEPIITKMLFSTVLSIVFQIYIQAMKLIRERSFADRQEALNLAFSALRKENATNENGANQVDMADIRKVLKLLRPHYNDEKVRFLYEQQRNWSCAFVVSNVSFNSFSSKVDVLVEIVGPNEIGKIDFNTFR